MPQRIAPRLRVFVSSRMSELAPERKLVKEALDELKVDAWVFEEDAGARPESIEQTFLEEVETADLYLGIFWKGYGPYTREEYDHAVKLGKDRLVYEKRVALDERVSELEGFLADLGRVSTGVTPKWFESAEELRELVKEDVASWQTRVIRRQRQVAARIDDAGSVGWDYTLSEFPDVPAINFTDVAITNISSAALSLGISLVVSFEDQEIRTAAEGTPRTAWKKVVARMPGDHAVEFLASPMSLDVGETKRGFLSFFPDAYRVARMVRQNEDADIELVLEARNYLTEEVVRSESRTTSAANLVRHAKAMAAIKRKSDLPD